MCGRWVSEYEQDPPDTSLNPGLVCAGLEVFAALPVASDRTALLSTDLHAGYVLIASRQPWLAIDPKPHVGDPTYDVLQHLINSLRRLAPDPDRLVERVAGLTGRRDLDDVARRLAPR